MQMRGDEGQAKNIWPKEGEEKDFPLTCDSYGCQGEVNGQKIAVAFGIEDNHHLAVVDVLRRHDLQQTRFTYARCAHDRRVSDALRLLDRYRSLPLVQPHRMQRRVALNVGPWRKGVQKALTVQWP